MVDPTKLVASAKGVYGDELFEQLYGEVIAIEAARVETLEDDAVVALGQRRLRVRHTRGHAEHHFCLFDEQSRGWFSGDMFGVSYPGQRFESGSFVMPATTPTQFDPDLYQQSVRALASAAPRCVYLTHYSALPFHATQADSLCRQLEAYAELGDDPGTDSEALEEAVLAIARAELGRLLPADDGREAQRPGHRLVAAASRVKGGAVVPAPRLTASQKRESFSGAVAVGVVGLPAPGVLAHVRQVPLRHPIQGLARKAGVRIALGHVAGTPGDEVVGNPAAAGFLEGPDDLQHAVAATGAKVQHQG